MSLHHKRSPRPGLLPLPAFADTATVVQAIAYRGSTSGAPSMAALGFYGRNLQLIEMSMWVQGTVVGLGTFFEAVAMRACLFNRDTVQVPNGAEWWGLATTRPTSGAATRFASQDLYRVRWRLSL